MKLTLLAVAFIALTCTTYKAAFEIGQTVNRLGISKPDIRSR